ncbi:hypothetical protein PENTCL1PPCAC_23531, partial [Pristionchus entomophagus]
IKLEMEKRNDEMDNRTHDLMELYLRELIMTARSLQIEISEGDMHIISEGRLFIKPFTVASDNWKSILIPFTREFFDQILSKCINTHEMPLIVTHSPLLYPLKLVTAHRNVPLTRIQFGSMMNNGRLGIHWSMIGGPDQPGDRELGYCYHKGIYAFFAYDKQNISMNYCDVDNQRKSYDGKISIEMPSINRILFDQYYEQDDCRISLVLLLQCPPKLEVRQRSEKGKEEESQQEFHKWEYQDQLLRGEFPREKSDKEALHDSKALILQFDRVGIKDKLLDEDSCIDAFFHEILSRLRHKTGKKIEYCAMDRLWLLEGEMRKFWRDERGRKRLNARPD